VTKRLLLKGDPAREIAQSARDEKEDLIVMSTHGRGSESAEHKRLSSLDNSPPETPKCEFAIRNVLLCD